MNTVDDEANPSNERSKRPAAPLTEGALLTFSTNSDRMKGLGAMEAGKAHPIRKAKDDRSAKKVGDARTSKRNTTNNWDELMNLKTLATTLVVSALSISAASADILDTIKERGKLIVGTKADYKPYGFLDTSGAIDRRASCRERV